MRYGSVEAMVAYLDRKEIAAEKERRMRKIVRPLSRREREFALTLKRVLLVVPGSKDENRQEIMQRMDLGPTCYYELRERTAKRLAEVKRRNRRKA